MLPLLALIAAGIFLILSFSGVLEDLGRKTSNPRADPSRLVGPAHPSGHSTDMDRRLKVFEGFFERLSRTGDDEVVDPGEHKQDHSPKD